MVWEDGAAFGSPNEPDRQLCRVSNCARQCTTCMDPHIHHTTWPCTICDWHRFSLCDLTISNTQEVRCYSHSFWATATVGRFEALACMSTHVTNPSWLRAQSTRRRSRANAEEIEASLFAFLPNRPETWVHSVKVLPCAESTPMEENGCNHAGNGHLSHYHQDSPL